MSDRLRRKAAEAWEEERQMNELNDSLRRADERKKIAESLARASFIDNDDVEVGGDVEYVDGGYWVTARVFVDAEDVEEAMTPGAWERGDHTP